MHQGLEDKITSEILLRRGERLRTPIAKKFSKLIGINESTANKFISDLETGQITSTSSYETKPKVSEHNLKRMAVYLNLLGVKRTDPLIGDIRTSYPEFKYPIKSF
ncbi:MAG: hypothetical protein Q8R00_01455 [Candidatus Nanoarchaeia archaeon]|nr:hypothetical protein [Candidatus Nanoarchaeia archaeon]